MTVGQIIEKCFTIYQVKKSVWMPALLEAHKTASIFAETSLIQNWSVFNWQPFVWKIREQDICMELIVSFYSF